MFYLATNDQVYWEVLRDYFDYEYDTKTIDILADQDKSVITKVDLETEHIFSHDPEAYIDQMVITEKEVRYVKKDFSNDKVMEEWESIVNQKDYQRLCKQSKRLFWCSMNNVNNIDYEYICFDAGVFKITITLANGNKYCYRATSTFHFNRLDALADCFKNVVPKGKPYSGLLDTFIEEKVADYEDA